MERKDGRILRYMKKRSVVYQDESNLNVSYDNFALSSEEDRDGNTLNYHYADFWSVDVDGLLYPYLSEISYGNAVESKPGTPDDTGSRRIIFTYDETPRPDPVYYHVDHLTGDGTLSAKSLSRSSMLIARRLRSISCFAPGPKDPRNAASELAWTYTLSYLQSLGSGRSILASVVRTGALGGTSFAKEFAWQQTKGGTYTKTATTIGPFGMPTAVDIASVSALAVDVDNDGKDELLVNDGLPSLLFTGASGPVLGQTKNLPYLSNLTFNNARIADLDGDGVPEILAPDLFADANNTRHYRLYTWSSPLQDYRETVPATSFWDNYRQPLSFSSSQPIFLPDFDGDGLPDLVQARHTYAVDPSCIPNPRADGLSASATTGTTRTILAMVHSSRLSWIQAT